MESKAFCIIISPSLFDCFDFLSHRCNVASLSFFYCYFHADCSSELANCMPPTPSRGLAAQEFPLLILILSIFLMQKLISIFTLSSLTLGNSGTLFLCLFFYLSRLERFQKRNTKTSHFKLDLYRLPLFLLLSSLQCLATSGILFNFIFLS